MRMAKEPSPSVLVIDDEPVVRESVSRMLYELGFCPMTADSGEQALEMAIQAGYDIALVDLSMPGLPGLETIRRLKAVRPETEIVIMTGNPSLETSLAALDEHVFAYLCKPLHMKVLARSICSAAEHQRLVRQNRELVRELETERNLLKKQVLEDRQVFERHVATRPDFVGESKAMANVRLQIAEVASSDMTVLIRGESGTGKDVVARLIAEISGRNATGAFVKINCPAIPETLLESDLFGHEAGAFTGADRRKPGRFELAAGGTVFLDEIAEIPTTLQAKLLQVIEHKQFCRLGDTKTIHIDTRILAATNAAVEEMIATRQFRADLFHRLNDYCIVLPPLRTRMEDVPPLVDHFIAKHGAVLHRTPEISAKTMSAMMGYTWPGNVRELEAVIRRFALTGDEETILAAIGKAEPRRVVPVPGPSPLARPPGSSLRAREIKIISEVLAQTGWNRRRAAELLGTTYSTLRRKIQVYGLKKPAGLEASGGD